MDSIRILLVLFAAVCLTACGGSGSSSAESPPPVTPVTGTAYAGVDLSGPYATSVTQGIVYDNGLVNPAAPLEQALLLDLYEPDANLADANVPAVVIIHGGGFISGSRQQSQLQRFGQELAAAGFVAVSIDYRLVPDDPVLSDAYQAVLDSLNLVEPELTVGRALLAALEDAEKARLWLTATLADQGVNVQGVAMMGSSAGAITALDHAYSLDDFGIQVGDVDAVAALWGSLILGRDDDTVIESADAPVFMIHGTADPTVDYETGSLRVAGLAAGVGLAHELITNVGAGHGYGENDVFEQETFPGSGQTQAQRLYQFLAVALLAADCLRQEGVIDNCPLP